MPIFLMFLFVLSGYNLNLLAADPIKNELSAPMVEWVVLSDFDDVERQKFLHQKAAENLFRQLKEEPAFIEDYYSANVLMGLGFSFSYLGSIERLFLSHLQSIDELNEKTILFPGCGTGRSVLDALKKTKNFKIIANDFSSEGIKHLKNAVNNWFESETGRVTFDDGDIFTLLPTLADESIDVVFCANLIHFFDPEQIDLFFKQLQRVLKPQGRIFLTWQGFDSFRAQKPGNKYQIAMDVIKHLQSINSKYYTFIAKEMFSELKNISYDYSYNFIPKAEVFSVAKYFGFTEIFYQKFELNLVTNSSQVVKNSKIPGIRNSFAFSETSPSDSSPVTNFGNDALILQKTASPSLTQSPYSEDFVTWKTNSAAHKCHHCRALVEKTKKCSACKTAQYCSKSCQTSAWPSHKSECKKKE